MKPSCFLPSALMRLALLWVAASVATVAGAATSDFKRVALPFLE